MPLLFYNYFSQKSSSMFIGITFFYVLGQWVMQIYFLAFLFGICYVKELFLVINLNFVYYECKSTVCSAAQSSDGPFRG